MVNEITQRKTSIVWSHLHVESKKNTEFIETESRLGIVMGGGAK